MTARFAFVGLSWWGLGPEEMARAVSHFGPSSDSINVWNISRRSDRWMMDSRWAPFVAARRLSSLGSHDAATYQAIFVVSPHRLNVDMLRYLKSRCEQLIAILGDDPVGSRSLRDECWAQFDGIFAADEYWLRDIPPVPAKCQVMPWGSTITDSDLINADPYTPESVVLVGSPYPERVAVAQHLVRRNPVTLQGDAWPDIPGVKNRPSSSRLETLNAIRENRELVVNIHHKQFRRGLNPQFFDYAAAGIPQVVVHTDNLLRYRLGMGHDLIEGTLLEEGLLLSPIIQAQNLRFISIVRDKYSFHSCIERLINEN